MAARGPAEGQVRPEVDDILLVIHDFQARSSDELSLAKGDRVKLAERDDEFGDGWFLGQHMGNGNTGLFPEVYTRPAPKNIPSFHVSKPLAPVAEAKAEPPDVPTESSPPTGAANAPAATVGHIDSTMATTSQTSSSRAAEPTPVTRPLNTAKQDNISNNVKSHPAANNSSSSLSSLGRLNTSQDSQVLNETLHVINEHITDLHSTPGNASLAAPTDSGSEYSTQLERRLSYIQGEETDEEEEGSAHFHTRAEVEAWSADDVAEYLFTAGVEKHHCEVFRDQEITGEVLLGLDQSSLFIKAFDLGSVGRRLKTWQKIKSLQDEIKAGQAGTRRTTQTYGSEVGSDHTGRARSRANTLTSSIQRYVGDDRPMSVQTKRLSSAQTPRLDASSPLVSPVSPTALHDSPTRPAHAQRPSAASIRDLHHSRRHSSTDFRLTGTTMTSAVTPKLTSAGTFPQGGPVDGAHKKQPSFDRNWTMGNAYSPRPVSSAGFPDMVHGSNPELQDSAVDLDRGYFSSTDVDRQKRNVLKKRESAGAHSRQSSYADEQRARTGTAIARHSRYGSVDSVRDGRPPSAAQKYYGLASTTHRRTASTNTAESIRPVPPAKDLPSPTVTKLDGTSVRGSPVSPVSPSHSSRQGFHADWLSSMAHRTSTSIKAGGLNFRSTSDSADRHKLASPADSSVKDSPMESPARTGSSTPSGGPSFEIDSPDATKSPISVTVPASRPPAAPRRKNKKETSAYQRGLLKMTPKEVMKDADYSGWMKKKSSNLMTTWKPRLFVLKGRRLSYFYSEDDDMEKGLIDISFHRVLPADNERLTGLHATLTGAGTVPAAAAGDSNRQPLSKGDDTMFIFKLMPPRAGLSRAVNFTKPTVHYFAVPNLQQGRLWMAALMKATIDRDDTQPITTTYQQKTISLAKARAMRHRPPALMGLDDEPDHKAEARNKEPATGGLGISFGEADSGVSGLEKVGLSRVESGGRQHLGFGANGILSPQSA